MKILFASSEVAPFSKTGGLADVAGSLPAAMAGRGHEVTIITPRYGCVDVAAFDLRRRRTRLAINVKGKSVQGGLLEGNTPNGVPVLFVDQPGYFDREGLYGSGGQDFPDNDERFAFFSRAVLESCRQTGLEPDVIHCNDWQTGPVPALLQFEYRERPELNSTGTVFTIHNMGYPGLFAPEAVMTLGLGWNLFTPSGLEFFGKVSYLKAGLRFADKLTTVSRTHAEEILTPAFGRGLEGLLKERAGDLKGILNGVDYQAWDPQNDPNIARKYSPDDPSGKAECKADLQRRMNLPADPANMLVGSVCRLVSDKGVDLFLEGAPDLLKLPCQWVFLGEGDTGLAEALRTLALSHPEQVAVHIGHDEELAHRIQAGADVLLMPSRYEPCGLSQMYGLRYGTVPLVRAVGGLEDSIDDVAEGGGNGFKFDQATPQELLATVKRALELFADRAAWGELVEFVMYQDFSWEYPARRYEAVYREIAALRAPSI
jgi:starch synthase